MINIPMGKTGGMYIPEENSTESKEVYIEQIFNTFNGWNAAFMDVQTGKIFFGRIENFKAV